METFILGAIGPMQIVLIILVILLLFGGAKIPQLMRNLGSGIKEFKNAAKDPAEENKDEDKPAEK